MKPFLASSSVKRRVIFSSSCSEYSLGFILIPALAPPKGTSTQAHLKVISAERAFTSSLVTSVENLIPERKTSLSHRRKIKKSESINNEKQ